ncbi:MAG: hypothetical protein V2J20_00060 [Wenzhouxiangella sp.]|jgi:cytochrome c-type biogenesis protein CcmH|nr:hypothetical protein [Wenzhouxiangella sp.]
MNENTFAALTAMAIVLALVFSLWPNIKARLLGGETASGKLPGWLVLSISISLPVVTLTGYLLVGTYGEAGVDDPRITLLRSQLTEMARALEQNPEQPELWQRMGLAYKDLQHYGSAEHTLRRALYLRPNSAFLHVELAETLKFRNEGPGMPPEATQLLERAVALEPDNLKALWLLATDEFRAGHYENALSWWEQMLPLVPENSTIHQAIRTETQRAQRIISQNPQ